MRSIGLTLAACLVAGCQLLPTSMTLDCTTVDPVTCDRLAREVVGRTQRENPGKRIVSVTIWDDRGSHEVMFDDGSGTATIID